MTTDPKAEVDELIRLATWARSNGYRIGAVKIGSLSLQIADLRIDDHEGLKPDQHQPRGIWADAGMADGPLPTDGTIG